MSSDKKVKMFNTENNKGYGTFKPNDVVSFKVKLKEGYSRDDIEYYFPDCGVCTSVNLVGDEIVGTIDVSKAHYQPYEKGKKTAITKYVYVYHQDGESQFIGAPGTKLRMANPEKSFERVTIPFVVQG